MQGTSRFSDAPIGALHLLVMTGFDTLPRTRPHVCLRRIHETVIHHHLPYSKTMVPYKETRKQCTNNEKGHFRPQ